jgi:hypothetical protein
MKNNYQETHGSAAIRQHVEHGSELGGLVQEPGRVTINGIKKAAQLKGNYTSCLNFLMFKDVSKFMYLN